MFEYAKYLFIVPMAAVGFFTLRTDLKKRIIRNSIIIKGFIAGSLIYLFFFSWTVLGIYGVRPFSLHFYGLDLYFYALLDLVLALIVGYFFWHYGIWAAGDAKLFALFAFLLPVDFYSGSFLWYFPASALLVNIFILASLYYIMNGLAGRIKIAVISGSARKSSAPGEDRPATWAEKLSEQKKNLPNLLIILGAVFLIMPILRNKYSYLFDQFQFLFTLLLILAVHYFVKKMSANKKAIIFLAAVSVLYVLYNIYFFGDQTVSALSGSLAGGLFFWAAIITVKKISFFATEADDHGMVDIGDLKEGMFPTENMISEIKKDAEFGLKFGSVNAMGLNRDQVLIFRKFIKKIGWKNIAIYHTSPFCGFILAGSAVTILIKQNLVHFFIGSAKEVWQIL